MDIGDTTYHSELLLSSLNDLYTSGTLTDIVLKCGESTFNVHCVVLVAFSSVFEALLCTNFRNGLPSNTCLELQTLNSEQLEIVLKYLYTGSLQCSQEVAKGLLKVAETLGIQILQTQLKGLLGEALLEVQQQEEEETEEAREEEVSKEEVPVELMQEEQEDTKAACPSCEFTASNTRSMRMHMIGVHGEKPARNTPKPKDQEMLHSCDECDFQTRYYTSLRRHKMRHQGHFPYACEYCEYASNDATSLKKHARRHTGHTATQRESSSFVCPECSLTFSSKTGLKRHSWKHSGFMPYECDVCAQKFTNRECFIEHRFEHAAICAYACHMCQFECKKRPLLKAHYLREHNLRHHAIEPRCHLLGIDSDLKAKRFIKVNSKQSGVRQAEGEAGVILLNPEDILSLTETTSDKDLVTS